MAGKKGTNQWARMTLAERFWPRVNKNGRIVRPELGPCWEWTGSTSGGNYGAIRVNGKSTSAHRTAWLLETGHWPNPNALHKCDNRLCVRFSHLFEGTYKDNAVDCARKGRGSSALTREQIIAVRNSTESQSVLAKKYNTFQSQISRIKSGIRGGWA